MKPFIDTVSLNASTSESYQSIFFHMAILNTINRSLSSTNDCECTPHPGYFVDKTSFWCQEDYLYNVEDLQDYFNANLDKATTLGGTPVIEYVNSLYTNNIKDVVSFKEIYFLTHLKEQFNNGLKTIVCPDGSGSGLGCCGNYAGCCWYWSLDCLRHDMACINCDHWYCLPGCKPGA